jgi:hypothetical protein
MYQILKEVTSEVATEVSKCVGYTSVTRNELLKVVVLDGFISGL